VLSDLQGGDISFDGRYCHFTQVEIYRETRAFSATRKKPKQSHFCMQLVRVTVPPTNAEQCCSLEETIGLLAAVVTTQDQHSGWNTSLYKGGLSMAVYFKKIIDSNRGVCLIFLPWFFLQGLCSCHLIPKPLCASHVLHFFIYLR